MAAASTKTGERGKILPFDSSSKVIRCQSNDAPSESTTCVVCGFSATKNCAACKSAMYCSREHQVAHWTQAYHKELCSGGANAFQLKEKEALKALVFPERFIETDLEDYSEQELTEVAGSLALMPTKTIEAPDSGEWQDEEFEEASSGVDKAFLRFQKRIRFNPDQILRYARSEDETAQPLYASDLDKPPEHVPPCPSCGGERSFEMQIMPQLLNYLQLNDADPHAMDFGSLFIFSCDKSCAFTGDYQEEIIWKQNFSTESAADSK